VIKLGSREKDVKGQVKDLALFIYLMIRCEKLERIE
jgi:hypothetical protein